MKIFLALTEPDCFRMPEVLDRIREGLREGDTVAISTRDHPETLPEWVFHAGDDWSAVVTAEPHLAVLDNLRFEDPGGRAFERWNGEAGRYVAESVDFLGAVIDDLADGEARELLLVCEEERISEGWSDWMTRRGIFRLEPGADAESVRCRRWELSGPEGGEHRYRYRDGHLLRRTDSASPRLFGAEVTEPRSEALLALAGEYAALRYEYANPDDPRRLNARADRFHEIVGAFGGTSDPRGILDALEEMYDWVSEHVDFSRPRMDRAGNGELPGCPAGSGEGGDAG